MARPAITERQRRFVWLGRAVGVSLLIQLFVAVPLKRLGGVEDAAFWFGWVHGAVFLAYCVGLFRVARAEGWARSEVALAWVIASVPFGNFWFERRFTRGP